ncbi:MAG: alpha-hydroxy-acid oxidizing protein [Deltaproteobacteria bacterium]|nr:alpha-hydroxy-acid oxidizing protein [Deltaproteobacteria bacterium]
MNQWDCLICYNKIEADNLPAECNSCGANSKSIVLSSVEGEPADPKKFRGLAQNLEDTRDRARMKLRGLCAVYPHCDGGDDKICQKEAYGKPIGFGGAGSGSSFAANVKSLDNIRLKMRVVGDHFTPDTETTFLGEKISVPVMGASTAGIQNYNHTITEHDFCRATIRGCREAGTITWRGDTFFYTPEDNPALSAIEKEKSKVVQIFKPRAQDVLKQLIEMAEKAGCLAVGVDLDGCGSTIMARNNQPVFRKSVKDIKELVSFSSLPFITKGIMTPEDAEDCAEAGVSAVSVSNHGGRVLDCTRGVAEVLPAIAERLKGKVTITADGGVRTGYDAFKMIALGADAVLNGRDVIRAAVGSGSKGVFFQMERFKQTLRQAMMMTRCPDISSINKNVLD